MVLLVRYWLALATLGFLSQASSKNIHEYELRAKLLTNYSKLDPPQPINTPVNVSYNIAIASLKNMDVKKEEISLNIWQRQYWHDQRLAWNSSKHGDIKQLAFLMSEMWHPNIYLYYSSGSINKFGKDIPGSLPFSTIAYHNGLQFFSQPTTIYAPCEVDVGFYPFDDQVCKLTVGTWSQDVSVVRMFLRKGGIDLGNYLKHNEWEIVSVKASTQTVQLNAFNNRYAVVVYTIHLRRHALFYMINYILPSIIIAILSLLLFLIPPEVGKRMEAGINLLLCLSVYLMLVNSKMPLSSKSFPLITKFYGCTIMVLAVSLCCACWVYSYYFMNPSGWDVYHLPAVLEKVIFNCLGPAFHLHRQIPLLQPSNHGTVDEKSYDNQALDEDHTDDGLQNKPASEASADQSKNNAIVITERGGSLVDGVVVVEGKEAFAKASTDQFENEMIGTQGGSSLVDGNDSAQTKETAEVNTDQSQNEMVITQSSSLVDGANSVDDREKEVDEREQEGSTTASCVSANVAEEAENSLVNETISDDKEKEDSKQERESSTAKDDCDQGNGVKEDGSSMDSSKKKKKKKKKKAAKLIRKTITVQKVAKTFEQHIQESSRAEDDGDDNNDNTEPGYGNITQEEDDNKDVTDKKPIEDPSPDKDVGDVNCNDNAGLDSSFQEEANVSGIKLTQDPSRAQDDGDDHYDGHDNNHREEEHVTETSITPLTTATTVPSDSPHPNHNRPLLYLAQSSQQRDQKFENSERWKLAAIILDRLFIILLVVSIIASFLACFLSSPRVRKGLI